MDPSWRQFGIAPLENSEQHTDGCCCSLRDTIRNTSTVRDGSEVNRRRGTSLESPQRTIESGGQTLNRKALSTEAALALNLATRTNAPKEPPKLDGIAWAVSCCVDGSPDMHDPAKKHKP